MCSPDGTRLIFMLKSGRTLDDWELYLLDRESQVQSRLTFHQGWDGYAVWSPDGAQIIYDRAVEPEGKKDPWVMDLDGLTGRPLGDYEGWLSVSDWSVNKQLLAFHELDGQRDLVLLDLEGNITRRLTTTSGYSEHDAHFSPDGTQIAYANGEVEGSVTTLELLELQSGETEVLRSSPGRIYGIAWSPDGQDIAFVDAPGGEEDDADVFIYSRDDESIQRVTDDPAWDHMPAYCGDRHTLFFTSYRSGEERIYQIDPDPSPYLRIERAGEARELLPFM